MILSFVDSKFILSPIDLSSIPKGWKQTNSAGVVATTRLIEAARFRKHADKKAERVFQKLTLKAYAIPAGGLLSPSNLSLLPFQREQGIPFILKQNRTYIAHQPGLGKSAQAITAVNSRPGRCLIICPSFLKTTWMREITKWSYRDFPAITIVPESSKRLTFEWTDDYIICSDAMLAKDWVMKGIAGANFRYCFIDEAHRFKNHEAARSIALFGGKKQKLVSPGIIYNIETVCALSGTPMLNKPIELWAILYAMAPETIDFMSYHSFGFKYCGGFQDDRGHWQFTGSSNEAELNKRIMGTFMQRIRKEDVLKDLPDKVRDIVVMDQDPRHPDSIQFDKELSKKMKLGNFQKLESLGEYALMRHENGMAKVPWIVSMVKEYLTNNADESIILFAHHRDVVATFAKLLVFQRPAVINGGVKNEERTKIQDDFQSGKCRLIIGNIDAMNLGLTLTRATRVIFAEYAWTPALNEQAEDRAHRIGQRDCVYVQYVVLPNSIDEKILQSLLKKEDSIERVIG